MVRAGQLEFEVRTDLRFDGRDREYDRWDWWDEQALAFDEVVRVGEVVGGHDVRDRDVELSSDARDRVSPFQWVIDRRGSRRRWRGAWSGRGVRERLLLGVTEQRRERLPVGGPATVGACDAEFDGLAVRGADDLCVLGAAVDLATEPSAALVGGDVLDDVTINEGARGTRGIPQESRGVRSPVAGQGRLRRKQHCDAAGLSCNHEMGCCARR